MSEERAALLRRPLIIGRLALHEKDEAARLIHGALATWYAQHLNQAGRFGLAWEPFRIFPEVYEALDPGCAVSAREAGSGQLLGICFYHPRPSHLSVGIVATLPEAGGCGVARAMLEEVFGLAEALGLPVRLVSSLMNLDSYSLYTKLGFVPGAMFQDMQFPPGVLPGLTPLQQRIRPAVPSDVPAMAELETALTGLDRRQDFAFFLKNQGCLWQTFVLIGPDGQMQGFLSSLRDGDTRLLGPGLMRDEAGALALIAAQLHAHAPGNPVFLVPVKAAGLVAALYRSGAKNVELHTAQVRGAGRDPAGVVIPTFLPESG